MPSSIQRFADWYRGRTVAVTGAYGYIGAGLCERLRSAGAKLRRATRGRAGAAADDECLVGDVSDAEFCHRLIEGADAVFHLAAQTSIKTSHEDPVGDLRANVESTLRLLDACARAGRKPAFVYAGTTTEIGFTDTVPVPAGTPDRPLSVYDANKLAAEHLIGVYSDAGSVRGITLRIANVYGPGAAKSAPDRGVTNKMIARAMMGQNLTYYGDGSMVRDYVYIDDLLEAFFRAAIAAPHPSERSCAIASGKGYTLYESFNLIADTVAQMGYPRVKAVSVPFPADIHPVDRRSYVGDIAPLAALCDWRPTISLEEGIRRTADVFRREGLELAH